MAFKTKLAVAFGAALACLLCVGMLSYLKVGAFERLHAAGEFPGTGVGLASIRRVINWHEGRLWAQRAVNQATNLLFPSPK